MNYAELYQNAARLVGRAGGRLYLVGGRVRDHFLSGTDIFEASAEGSRDVDILVLGLDLPAISAALAPLGRALSIGRRSLASEPKEEAVLHLGQGSAYLEISPARRWSRDGLEFSVEAGLPEDALTRDFSLNAIYFDPLTQAFEDPLGGIADAEARRLRLAEARSFRVDPLRMLRAMNFISRFGLRADGDLLKAAAENRPGLKLLPPERFWPEWKKWASGARPHLGLEYLYDSGLLEFWPSLLALTRTPQNPRFHPEGDVWRHTVLVVKAMSELEAPGCDRVLLTLAALLHDIGKPLVTEINEQGLPTSRGHAQAGPPLAMKFLESIRVPGDYFKPLAKLVERHMDTAFQELTPRALRRLARRLAPDCGLGEFRALAAADWNGRGPGFAEYPYSLEDFLAPLGGRDAPPEPLLRGRDLLEIFGLEPGPDLGRILKLIEEAGDDGRISGREEALAYARRLIEG